MKLKSIILFASIAISFDLYALDYRTYSFKDLSHKLGYPSKTFFGSTQDQRDDLDSYTSKTDTYYTEINGYLRFYPEPYDWNGTSPEIAKGIVSNIDSIFTRVPSIPKEIILFRGVDLKYRHNKEFEIGEEFVDKGYFSTTTSFKVANYFAIKKDKTLRADALKAIYVLYQNQNSMKQKGILIDQAEDEVILRHGQTFKIMADKKSSPLYKMYLVQICKIKCDEQMNIDIEKFWQNYNEETIK